MLGGYMHEYVRNKNNQAKAYSEESTPNTDGDVFLKVSSSRSGVLTSTIWAFARKPWDSLFRNI